MPCYVGLCYHGMVHPWVVDGGESLPLWRVAANILNKQSWTADKECSCILRLGEGLTTSHHKKPACYEMSQRAPELNLALSGRKWWVAG
jgi:hypothetical protein